MSVFPTLLLKSQKNVPAQSNWRFNPQLITNKKFCEYLETNIKLFFETNDTGNTSSKLWETFKAYLRRFIISFQSSLKKRNKVKQLELEEEIRQLDRENALHPSLEKHTKISTLKYKLSRLRILMTDLDSFMNRYTRLKLIL